MTVVRINTGVYQGICPAEKAGTQAGWSWIHHWRRHRLCGSVKSSQAAILGHAKLFDRYVDTPRVRARHPLSNQAYSSLRLYREETFIESWGQL